MAYPTIDAGSITTTALSTSNPYDTTVAVTIASNSDLWLIVSLKTYAVGYVNGVTYNGTALTLSVDSSVASHGTQIWTLQNPDTGTHNLIVDATGILFGYVVTACFYNVGSIDGGNTGGGTGTTATVSVQTTSTSVAVMSMGGGNNGTQPSTTETQISTWISGSQTGGMSYFNGDGSSKSMSMTWSNSIGWRSAGLNLNLANPSGHVIIISG